MHHVTIMKVSVMSRFAVNRITLQSGFTPPPPFAEQVIFTTNSKY